MARFRIRRDEVNPISCTSGEVEGLQWKGVVFKWDHNENDEDFYVVKGNFIGIRPGFVYNQLIIISNPAKPYYYLLTGKGERVTFIKLLDV